MLKLKPNTIHTFNGRNAVTICSSSLALVNCNYLHFNGHFLGEPSIASFIGAKRDGSGGDNWSYKTCKAPVTFTTNKPTTSFFTGWVPFLLSTNSVKALK